MADRLNPEWLQTVKTAYYVYSVHISHTFLLAETLASSLFLLILYLLARAYPVAFRLAETCELDGKLSGEESYIMGMMERTTHDQHPDAHACRLKVALAVSYSEERLVLKDENGTAWELDGEYAQYIKKVAHISASCRLSMEEELQLVELCKDDKGRIDNTDVENRAKYLNLLPSPFLPTPTSTISPTSVTPALATSSPTQVYLKPQKREGRSAPWFEFERTIHSFLSPGWSAQGWHGIITYQRPVGDALIGSGLMETVGDVMNDTMVGSQHKLGFLFLYDLLTGAVPARLSPSHADCSFTLGKLLATMAYCKVTENGEKVKPGSHYLPYAACAILSSYFFPTTNNPERIAISIPADRIPPLPPIPYTDAFSRGYILNRTTNPIGIFLQSLANYCQGFVQLPEWQTSRQRPVPREEMPQATMLEAKGWRLAKAGDTACEQRTIAPFELFDGCGLSKAAYEALVGTPLTPLGLTGVLEARVKGETPLSSLPFDLSSHSSSSSYVAHAMLERMAADMSAYRQQVEEAKESELRGIAKQDWAEVDRTLHSLASAMRAMRDDDSAYVRRGQTLVQALVNYVPQTDSALHEAIEAIDPPVDAEGGVKTQRFEYLMSRYSGQQLLMSMDFLVAVLLSSRAEADLQGLNPFLTPRLVQLVLTLSASILLHANRLGLIDRCMADCIEAMRLIRRLQSIQTKDSQADPSPFIKGLVIQTRTLVDGLTAHRHYTQPVPSPTSPAPSTYDPRFLVFEFIFNILLRPMQVQLVNDFITAVRAGRSEVQQMLMGAGKTTVVGPLLALILADGEHLITQVVPSALLPMSRAVLRSRFTALLPKRILTLEFDRSWKDDPRLIAKLHHKLEMARRGKGVVIATAVSVKSLFLKYIELLHQLDTADFASLTTGEDEDLQRKSAVADGLSAILALFHRGVLIMDEVDLLLHPLRSELNFPIGARLPLDPAPERWALAIHLIDALFYHQTRYLSMTALYDVPEALEVLAGIQRVIEEGKVNHLMQASTSPPPPQRLVLPDTAQASPCSLVRPLPAGERHRLTHSPSPLHSPVLPV